MFAERGDFQIARQSVVSASRRRRSPMEAESNITPAGGLENVAFQRLIQKSAKFSELLDSKKAPRRLEV